MLRQAPHIHGPACDHGGPYGRPRLPVTDCFGGRAYPDPWNRTFPDYRTYPSPYYPDPYPPEPGLGGISSVEEIAKMTAQIVQPLVEAFSQSRRQERRAERRAEDEGRLEIRAKLAGEALATAAQVGASAEVLLGYVTRYRDAVEAIMKGGDEDEKEDRPATAVSGVVIGPDGNPRVAYGRQPASAPRVPFQGYEGEPEAVRRSNARVYGAGGSGAVITPEGSPLPPPLG